MAIKQIKHGKDLHFASNWSQIVKAYYIHCTFLMLHCGPH